MDEYLESNYEHEIAARNYNRLVAKHNTEGLKLGIEQGIAENIQLGFHAGYLEGTKLGFKQGELNFIASIKTL